ncbi:hypothetical protein [Ligilactobacillus equi]|uniref:hypothetical protein n=1 Tax=Ligilactobacillus equi TaxID=137357 RepID=UPI000468F50B|nr:hypothetical protein [Ligilactobacillus equi]
MRSRPSLVNKKLLAKQKLAKRKRIFSSLEYGYLITFLIMIGKYVILGAHDAVDFVMTIYGLIVIIFLIHIEAEIIIPAKEKRLTYKHMAVPKPKKNLMEETVVSTAKAIGDRVERSDLDGISSKKTYGKNGIY